MSGKGGYISIRDFRKMLAYLERSKIQQVRLLGGEPTIHPDFPELVRIALNENKSILVFTNGLLPENSLKTLEALDPNQCQVLVNINSSKGGVVDPEIDRRRKRTITRLNHLCRLGFTIYDSSYNLDHLVPFILETDCQRTIRLGLAHPATGGNIYLHPKLYPMVGHKIAGYTKLFIENGIQTEFDCGFVRCMFSEDDIVKLKSSRTACRCQCSPVIDLCLDGGAVPCLALSTYETIENAVNLDADTIRMEFERRLNLFRHIGIYRECSKCPFFQSHSEKNVPDKYSIFKEIRNG
jgi:MoaA/NifB/PqqE/SkfB family radical SAM enzyme